MSHGAQPTLESSFWTERASRFPIWSNGEKRGGESQAGRQGGGVEGAGLVVAQGGPAGPLGTHYLTSWGSCHSLSRRD